MQQAARNAASASTQLINAAGGAGKSNRNQATQQQLMTQCKAVADDVIPRLVQGLRITVQRPDDPNSQLLLISAAQDMLQVGSSVGGVTIVQLEVLDGRQLMRIF